MSSATNITSTILDNLACVAKKEVEKFSSRLETTKQELALKYVKLIEGVQFPSTCVALEGPCADPDVIATLARYGWGYQANEKVQPYTYAIIYNPCIVPAKEGNAHAFPELDVPLFEITTNYVLDATDMVTQGLVKANGRKFTVSTEVGFPPWISDIYSKVFEDLSFTRLTSKVLQVELLED